MSLLASSGDSPRPWRDRTRLGTGPRRVSAGHDRPSPATPLAVVVERELRRVRAEPDDVDLVLALPVDPCRDQLLAEHAAREQELVVSLECVERLAQRRGHLGDAPVLLEQVVIGRVTRVELAL